MDLSSLKEQLSDQFKDLKDRVQESSLYIELKEKFEVLPSRMQKLILGGGAALIALFLLSFPYANLSDSWSYEEQFTENRELIRELLRASSTLKESSPLPTSVAPGGIEARVRQVIQELRLTPEQVGNIQAVPGAKTRLASSAVNQEALSVQLKKLNLRQIMEASYRLQNLGTGIQPISLQMHRSAGETHYFDVIYKIFQFSLNIAGGAEEGGGEKAPSPRGGARGSR